MSTEKKLTVMKMYKGMSMSGAASGSDICPVVAGVELLCGDKHLTQLISDMSFSIMSTA